MTIVAAPKRLPGGTQIAGTKSVDQWDALCAELQTSPTQALWEDDFDNFFRARLNHRYLWPIEALEKQKLYEGEGFSIVAIQCCLIEFLEATLQGKIFRLRKKSDPPLTIHEYDGSKVMFKTFLKTRFPFNAEFDENWAERFYKGVRCGLLHEAGTRGGWRIHYCESATAIVDKTETVVFRNKLQKSLEDFVGRFRSDLLTDGGLQEAFIRKMNGLCYE